MSKITSFKELIVWQKSMDLAERSYRISKRFKREDNDALPGEYVARRDLLPLAVLAGTERDFGDTLSLAALHHETLLNQHRRKTQRLKTQ